MRKLEKEMFELIIEYMPKLQNLYYKEYVLATNLDTFVESLYYICGKQLFKLFTHISVDKKTISLKYLYRF